MDSPLYPSRQAIGSPNVIPKSQYLGKVEEMRHISAQLNETRHLYDETSLEVQRLSSSYQTLELQHKEMEVRLKRRELELTELRDELAFERESRIHCEKALQNHDHVRERLRCSQEELKNLSNVSTENHELHRELSQLRAKVKSLETRPRIVDQQLMQQQLNNMKESLRLAEEKVYELLCEREQTLATSEAEVKAKAAQPNRSHRSKRGPFLNLNLNISPDSSQPEIGDSRLDDSFGELQPPASVLSPRTPRSPRGENLASVVAVNRQIQDLEASLCSTGDKLQETERQLIHWQCRTISAQALSSHRLEKIRALQTTVDTSAKQLETSETIYAEKFTWMETQLTAMKSRIQLAEEAVRAYEEHYVEARTTWIAKEVELQEKLRKCELQGRQACDDLTAKLKCHLRSDDELNQELSALRCQLDEAEQTIQAMESEHSEARGQWTLLEEDLRKVLRQKDETAQQIAADSVEDLEVLAKALQLKDDEIVRLGTVLEGAKVTTEQQMDLLQHQCSEQTAGINQLQDTLREKTGANERLANQLKEQLDANDAYRQAAEEEVDNLRNHLGNLSSEYTTALTDQKQQTRLQVSRLQAEIDQLKETGESASRQVARLQLVLEEQQQLNKLQGEQLKEVTASLETKSVELNKVLVDYGNLEEVNTELKHNLDQANAETGRLMEHQATMKTHAVQLGVEEQIWRDKCNQLTSQTVIWQTELKEERDRAQHSVELLDAAKQDRLEAERRATLLRDQLRQIESDWLHSQAQLEQTRSRLTELQQLLHDTKLELQRVEYTRAEMTERLSRLEARQNRARLVRSTISLFTPGPPMRGDRVDPIDPPGSPSPQPSPIARDFPQTPGTANVSFTFVSPLPKNEDPPLEKNDAKDTTVAPTKPTMCDAAVQKCASHSVLKETFLTAAKRRGDVNNRHDKSAQCGRMTAPVSPAGLNQTTVFSGTSPSRHSRRFCRLLTDPEDEAQSNANLESKPLPKRPAKLMEGVMMRSKTVSAISTTNSSTNATTSSKTVPFDCENDERTFIPETPLSWNAPSALRSMSFNDTRKVSWNDETASIVSELSIRSDLPRGYIPKLDRQCSMPTSTSSTNKLSKLWKVKKMPKRSAESPDSTGMGSSVFTKPLPPPPHSEKQQSIKSKHVSSSQDLSSVVGSSRKEKSSKHWHIFSKK